MINFRPLLLTVILAAALLTQACAARRRLVYSSREIHGQVVDADTGAPLEGVIVVAVWLLTPTLIGHEQYPTRLHIIESVTDGGGNYVIRAWGPKALPPFMELDNTNPRLVFYRDAYEPTYLENGGEQAGSPLGSDWHNKVIRLTRFHGTAAEEEARQLGFYCEELQRGHGDERTDWQNYPRAILEMYGALRRIRASGLKPGYAPVCLEIGTLENEARTFLRERQRK